MPAHLPRRSLGLPAAVAVAGFCVVHDPGAAHVWADQCNSGLSPHLSEAPRTAPWLPSLQAPPPTRGSSPTLSPRAPSPRPRSATAPQTTAPSRQWRWVGEAGGEASTAGLAGWPRTMGSNGARPCCLWECPGLAKHAHGVVTAAACTRRGAGLQGTSMATPVTAGSATLVRQYFMDGFYPSGRFPPTVQEGRLPVVANRQ